MPASSESATPPKRRLRPLLLAVAGCIAFVLVALTGLVIGLETRWGMTTAVRLALESANPWPGYKLTLGGARGGFFGGIELHDLRLTRSDGFVLASIETLATSYDLTHLLGRPVSVRRVRVAGVTVHATQLPSGVFDLLAPFVGGPPGKPGAGFALGHLDLKRGSITLTMPRLGRDSVLSAESLTARISRLAFGKTRALALDTLSAVLTAPAPPADRLRLALAAELAPDRFVVRSFALDGARTRGSGAGTIALRANQASRFDGTDARIRLNPLAGEDIAHFLPMLGNPGDVTLDASARGARGALALHLDGRASRGGHALVDASIAAAGGPVSLHARGRLEALDLGALRGGARDSFVVSADWSADLEGPSLRTITGPFSANLAGTKMGTHRLDVAKLAGQFKEGRTTFAIEGGSAGLALTASGRASPFEHTPMFTLEGALTVPPDLTRPHDASGAPLPTRRPLFGGDIAFTLDGRGSTLDSAAARARIELHPSASSRSLLGAGTFDVDLERGLARVETNVAAGSGKIHAAGDLRLGPEPSYRLSAGEIAAVDWAAFTGDTVASRIDATIRGEGHGFDPRAAHVAAEIDTLALRYGSHRAALSSLNLRIDRGHAVLAASGMADGAHFEAHGALASLAPPHDMHFDLSVHGLDLALVTADSTLASDLRLKLEARIADPTRPASTTGSAHLECEPDSIGHQHLDQFALDGTLEHGDLSLRGRFASSFGRGQLAATGRPFDAAPSLRIEPLAFDDVDLSAIPGVVAVPTRLSGTVVATAAGRDQASLHGEARIALDRSRVRDVKLDRLVATLRLAAGRLDAEIEARSASNHVVASLRGQPFADPLRLTARGDVEVASLGRWLGRDSLAAGVAFTFDAGVTQPRGGGLARATAFANVEGRGHGAEVQLDTIGTALRLDDGVLEIDRLVLRSNVLILDGAGRVALPRLASNDSTSMRLTGSLLDPEPLVSLLGGPETVARGAHFKFAAHGPTSATRFSGALTAGGPHYGTSWADSISLDFAGMMRDTVLTALDARFKAQSLVVSMLRPRDLDATATWDGRRLAVEEHSVVDPERSQGIAFQIEPTGTGAVGRLERLDERLHGSVLALAHPVDFEFGKRFHVDDLVLNDNGVPIVRANGGISDQGATDFTFGIDSLDVTEVFDQLGIENLKGRLDASGSLTGTRSHPVLQGSLRSRLIAGRGKPALLSGELRCDHDTLGLSLAFEQAPGHRLALAATLPVGFNLEPPPGSGMLTRTDRPMQARLVAKHFGFAWFEPLISPRAVRKPRGWLDGALTATGNPDAPVLAGSLTLGELEAGLPQLGTTYNSGHARLEFADRTMRILDARLKSGGGTLAASGQVELRGPGKRKVDLTTKLHKFVVMNTNQVKATLSGDLALSGRILAPAVRGKLEALETTVYAEGAETRRVEPVTLSRGDRIQLFERFGVDVTAARDDANALTDSLDVDVAVEIGKNVWVRRHSDPILALELRGNARVRKPAGGEIDVSGDLGVLNGRSYLSFTGRRFDINRAEVTLPGPIDKARGELEAVYQPSASASSEDIVVTAAVTIDSAGVDTRLSSQPYLDHAALLNYLLTGQVQGGMQTGTAYGLALGAAIGAVGGSAGRRLGLDVVQVTMDAYGGQTLSAGSYVDPRVYLGFRQPVVEGQTSNSNTSTGSTPTTEFEVEYEAWKRLLLNIQGSSTQYRFFLKPPLGR